MKAVILAGGLGTRIAEESVTKPKPMIEIGGRPIIWHIMKMYSSHGVNEFVLCCGYKGYLIKEYFTNYFLHQSDLTVNLNNNSIKVHSNYNEPWIITLINTGEFTQTGGRLKRISDYVGDQFLMTYGDGLSNIDLTSLIRFHNSHGKLATLTAVKPPGRFGALQLNGTNVNNFLEKPDGDGSWVNGGFFVLNSRVFDYIDSDETIWEKEPLNMLANDGELEAFFHKGFWYPMDTMRDKNYLENLWLSEAPPWKTWR